MSNWDQKKIGPGTKSTGGTGRDLPFCPVGAEKGPWSQDQFLEVGPGPGTKSVPPKAAREPYGIERAEAKRFAQAHGLSPLAEDLLARAFAAYADWLKADWVRDEKARNR